MDSISDIANDKLKHLSSTTTGSSTDTEKYARKPEVRSAAENEELADRIATKLGATNQLPYLAVANSGIPRSTLERLLVTALEKGYEKPKLFMYLVKQQPLWEQYQKSKAKRFDNL